MKNIAIDSIYRSNYKSPGTLVSEAVKRLMRSGVMPKIVAIALLLLLPSAAVAADTFVPISQTEGLLIQAPGASSVTVSRVPIQSIGTVTVTPGPITPGPIIPGPIVPSPTTDLASTLKKATDAVAYANKDEDARSIAFNVNFVTPYLTGNAKASDITSVLKTMSDAGIGANAGQWTAWWATFDASTKNMTMDQYKVALGTAVNALTASSNFESGEFMGVENFGLDLTKLMQLLEFIMKFLPIILALFK